MRLFLWGETTIPALADMHGSLASEVRFGPRRDAR
jgi:hypothetical protein